MTAALRWHRVQALLLKYWYVTVRSFDRLTDVFFWPVIDLMLWGFLTLYIRDLTDSSLASFLLGGIILWIFLWRPINDISLFVLEDFWTRNLYGMFASPMTMAELLLSLVLLGIVRSVIAFLLVALVALALYQFSIFAVGLLALALAGMILMLFGWAVGFAVSSLFFRYSDRVQVFGWGITICLQPFSCVFYPLAALPGWARAIAVLLPSTHVFEGMRAVLAGNPLPWSSFGIAAGESALLLLIGIWLFSIAIKDAKRTGLLAKY